MKHNDSGLNMKKFPVRITINPSELSVTFWRVLVENARSGSQKILCYRPHSLNFILKKKCVDGKILWEDLSHRFEFQGL